MQIRHIIAATVLGIALPMSAMAGDDYGKHLVKTLNLEGDRADQVQEIVDEYQEQKKELKEKMHDEYSALSDQKEQKLKSVLTKEEFKQYEALKETKKDMMKEWKEEKHG